MHDKYMNSVIDRYVEQARYITISCSRHDQAINWDSMEECSLEWCAVYTCFKTNEVNSIVSKVGLTAKVRAEVVRHGLKYDRLSAAKFGMFMLVEMRMNGKL